MSRTDHVLGCLAGLAIGDALGYPVEGWTRDKIETHYGRITGFVEPPIDPPERWRLPGLHSDDTQQALIVVETLIEEGRVDPDLICQKYLELAEGPDHLSLGAHRGAGRNFRYTIQSLLAGTGWNRGSRPTAGVGASMRAAPVGLTMGIDDAAIRTNTALQSLTTHNDPRAIAAACMVAHVVGQLVWMTPDPLRPDPFLKEEVDFLRRSEAWLLEAHGRHLARESRPILHHMSSAVEGIIGHTTEPPEVVLPGIAERATELAGYVIEHPCRGFAPAGVVSALYFFLHFGGEFESAVTEAINWGGDTDTVGAILGAFCGAFRGIDGIPDRWLEGLRGRDLVVSRARALAGDHSAMQASGDLADVELGWTLEEDAMRREKSGQPPVDSGDWVRRPVDRQRTYTQTVGTYELREHGDEGDEDAAAARARRHGRRQGRPPRRRGGGGRPSSYE